MDEPEGRLARLSRGANRMAERALGACGLVMVVVVAAQVCARYVFNHSLFWSEELARYLLVWMSFLGASVAYRRRVHPGIDTLCRRMPPSLRYAAEVASHLAALSFFAVMIFYGARFAWFVRGQLSPALNLPKVLLLAAIPLSGVLLLLHGLVLIAALRQRGRNGR